MSKKDGLMTVGDAAKGLGVDKKTIGSWLERFSEYFSPSARGDDGRLVRHIDDQDFLSLNTIRGLTQGMPNNAKDWNAVAAKLAEGYRDNNFPPEAATVRSVVAPLAQAMKVAESEAQKESALARLDEIRQIYEKQLVEKEKQITQLNDKLEQNVAEKDHIREELTEQIMKQREELTEQNMKLREELTEQIMKLREEKAAELARAQTEIARAQTELELWRSGRLKPAKNKPKEQLDGK